MPGCAATWRAEVPERGQVVRPAPAQVPAELVLLLDEHHRRAGAGGRDRGGHPRGAAAGDHHVGVGVALVVVAAVGVGRHLAGVHEGAQDLLVRGPQPLGLDERLVVEAGGQEPSGEPVDGLDVEAQRRPGVLRADLEARGEQAVRAADVRLVADLHHGARVEVARGEQPAGPVVLVAAGEHALARGRERRDDRVAGVARVAGAVPGEPDGAPAVDDLALARRQTPVGGLVGAAASCRRQDAHRAPSRATCTASRTPRTSCVSVCRSTTSHRRQPAPWYQLSVTQPRVLAWKYR